MSSVFEEVIANTKKKSWVQYLQDDMKDEKEQVVKGLEFERVLEKKFREKIESGEIEVKKVIQDDLNWAEKELQSGKVAAVDGTEVFPLDLISGSFCQVGVGGLSYTNTDPEINVQSITSHITEEVSPQDYFTNYIKKEHMSKFDKDAARSYWELECCFKRNENWIFRDGNLIPVELLRFEEAVSMLENNIESFKNMMGVIKGSKSISYRLLGKFLQNNEYIIVETSSDFLKNVLSMNRKGVVRKTRRFINDFTSSVYRGVFKAHTKSYAFEIHKDVLDKGIALVMADSIKSPRGLPFLLDLIDTKLRDLFENNYYKEKMYSFLMEKSQEDLLENIDEREMRY